MSTIFQGIFSQETATIAVSDFMVCVITALLIGAFLAFIHSYKNRSTGSFLITLFLLPAIVCVVIMMVNGNIGAGVAVAGAFSLVRFRSAPGNAREISTIFLAMGAGLICGMGYLGYAVLFAAVLGICIIAFTAAGIGEAADEKILRITIPETLNYGEVFDDIMEKYTKNCEMSGVKTTNMGSMFKLTYHVRLKDASKEKEFMDALRVKNGNLEISLNREERGVNEM